MVPIRATTPEQELLFPLAQGFAMSHTVPEALALATDLLKLLDAAREQGAFSPEDQAATARVRSALEALEPGGELPLIVAPGPGRVVLSGPDGRPL